LFASWLQTLAIRIRSTKENLMRKIVATLALFALSLLTGFVVCTAVMDVTTFEPAVAEQIVRVRGDARLALLLLSISLIAVKLLSLRIRVTPHAFESDVPEHVGPCVPVWVNTSRVHYMQTGAFTGFFRRARRIAGLPLMWLSGPEFHGYVRENRVRNTVGVTGRVVA
jgi:hypothetical protein